MTDAADGRLSLRKVGQEVAVEQALREMAGALLEMADDATLLAGYAKTLLELCGIAMRRNQTQNSTVLAFIGGEDGQLLMESLTAIAGHAERSCELAQRAFGLALSLGRPRLPGPTTPSTDHNEQSDSDMVIFWTSVVKNAQVTGEVLQRPEIDQLASLVKTKATEEHPLQWQGSQASVITPEREAIDANATRLAAYGRTVNEGAVALKHEAARLDQLAAFVSEISRQGREIRNQAAQITKLRETTDRDRQRRKWEHLDSYYTLDSAVLAVLYAYKRYADDAGIPVDPTIDLGGLIQGFEDRAAFTTGLGDSSRAKRREANQDQIWLSVSEAALDERATVALKNYMWIEEIKYDLLCDAEGDPTVLYAMEMHRLWIEGIVLDLDRRISFNHQEPIIGRARPLPQNWWRFTPPPEPGDIDWTGAPALSHGHLLCCARITLKERLAQAGIQLPNLGLGTFGESGDQPFVAWIDETGEHHSHPFDWPPSPYERGLVDEFIRAGQVIADDPRRTHPDAMTWPTRTVITPMGEGPEERRQTSQVRSQRRTDQPYGPEHWTEASHAKIRVYLSSASLGDRAIAWPPQLPGLTFSVREERGEKYVAVTFGVTTRRVIAPLPVPADVETRALLQELIDWQDRQPLSNSATGILPTSTEGLET